MGSRPLVLIAIIAALAGGCGGGEEEDPLFAEAPETVGTLSEESLNEAIVRDVGQIRGVIVGSEAEQGFPGHLRPPQ